MFDAVGVFNANCMDCQEMAKSVARYISPQLVALVLQDKKDREERLKNIDETMARLEAEKAQIKLDIDRGYGNNVAKQSSEAGTSCASCKKTIRFEHGFPKDFNTYTDGRGRYFCTAKCYEESPRK
jgi:hypothetical protein